MEFCCSGTDSRQFGMEGSSVIKVCRSAAVDLSSQYLHIWSLLDSPCSSGAISPSLSCYCSNYGNAHILVLHGLCSQFLQILIAFRLPGIKRSQNILLVWVHLLIMLTQHSGALWPAFEVLAKIVMPKLPDTKRSPRILMVQFRHFYRSLLLILLARHSGAPWPASKVLVNVVTFRLPGTTWSPEIWLARFQKLYRILQSMRPSDSFNQSEVQLSVWVSYIVSDPKTSGWLDFINSTVYYNRWDIQAVWIILSLGYNNNNSWLFRSHYCSTGRSLLVNTHSCQWLKSGFSCRFRQR